MSTNLIQDNSEQSQTARTCGKAYCCLSYRGKTKDSDWTWYIALATDSQWEADEWWRRQPRMARVYYRSGAIRNAK